MINDTIDSYSQQNIVIDLIGFFGLDLVVFHLCWRWAIFISACIYLYEELFYL